MNLNRQDDNWTPFILILEERRFFLSPVFVSIPSKGRRGETPVPPKAETLGHWWTLGGHTGPMSGAVSSPLVNCDPT